MSADDLAELMFEECRSEEQSVRVVRSDADAQRLRADLRRIGRAAGLRIRTARIGDTVVVVRLDAAVWQESTEVMRQKLAPG